MKRITHRLQIPQKPHTPKISPHTSFLTLLKQTFRNQVLSMTHIILSNLSNNQYVTYYYYYLYYNWIITSYEDIWAMKTGGPQFTRTRNDKIPNLRMYPCGG